MAIWPVTPWWGSAGEADSEALAAGGEVDCDHPGRDLGRTPGAGPAEAAGGGGTEYDLAGGREAGSDAKKKE